MTVASAGEEDREVGVLVRVRIADAAAEEHRGRVEQGPVSIIHLGKAREELAEVLDLVGLERDEVRNRRRLVTMVREAVVGLIDAQILRQKIAANFERGDARRISLQRQRDELIEHR